ncbi:MAG: bifunctional DNA primase/polymerase, partial [Candidatus Dormibacteria bacterium]
MTQRSIAPALAGAHYYRRLGWAVFPCRPGLKIPYAGTRGVNDATTDARIIAAWWAATPDANVAIACGASGLVVIDIDPRHGGDETWSDLVAQHGEPTTLQVCTPSGGSHYYYRAPDGVEIASGASVLGAGVDVRARGGYVLAPPSVVDGVAYVYEAEHGPREIAPVTLPPLPSWLRDALTRPRASVALGADDAAPIAAGARNTTLASIAGTMRRRGLASDEIVGALAVLNTRRCMPPLDEREVSAIAHSVARYEPATPLIERAMPTTTTTATDVVTPGRALALRPLADVEPEEIEWLWAGRIPRGKVTLLVGDPGGGKSYMTLAIAAALSRGRPLPDDERDAAPCDAILWNGEDGPGDTIRPRAEQCGADLRRVHIIDAACNEAGERVPFGLASLDLLAAELAARPEVAMVVIDPIAALLGG